MTAHPSCAPADIIETCAVNGVAGGYWLPAPGLAYHPSPVPKVPPEGSVWKRPFPNCKNEPMPVGATSPLPLSEL
jgi:hypothetical protein